MRHLEHNALGSKYEYIATVNNKNILVVLLYFLRTDLQEISVFGPHFVKPCGG
jgi:hypothetical protein